MHCLKVKSVLIVGLGLIGGSVAKGLRGQGLQVLAMDRNQAALDAALKDGTLDEAVPPEGLEKIIGKVDLIVIALPPQAGSQFLLPLASMLVARNVYPIVTDVSSVKSPVVQAAEALPKAFCRRFVPGHPIAGSERSGYHAARADLFRARNVILSPLVDTEPTAVTAVHRFWRALGSEVLGMHPCQHDQVLAATSHLPHLLAYAMVDVLLGQARGGDIFRYAAGGFADFSRLASSEPQLWAEIFSSNAPPLQAALDAYIADLTRFKRALVEKDYAYMSDKLRRSKKARQEFLYRYHKGSESEPPFEEELIYELQPGGSVGGQLNLPGDKSVSHRALILGAIAEGVTRVQGFLESEDSLCTLAALREMGVTVVGPDSLEPLKSPEHDKPNELIIYGVGKHGLQAPRKSLDMGNSGTAMRLLAGLLAPQPFAATLIGDESLCQRPMGRIARPLRLMGARISTAGKGERPPLHINRRIVPSAIAVPTGKLFGVRLRGITYRMPVASAQLKSCLLLAGLYADGETEIKEPAPCRDHSERMLAAFGYPLHRQQGICRLQGGHPLQATDIQVPADISSAAFFMVAAAITPGSELRLSRVGVNPTRSGIITLLRMMGGDVRLHDQTGDDGDNETAKGHEPVADISVCYNPLRGIEIPRCSVPLAIDEFPALFIAAACAEGETVLQGAAELRVKESDRIEAMAAGLRVLGVTVETTADGIRIHGRGAADPPFGGGEIDSRGDHRIAMAFAVAALRASAPLRIRRCNNVHTSFPGFYDTARAAGLQIEKVQT